MRNPHFLLDGFGVVAAGRGSRSGSALNENAGRAQAEQMDPKCAESDTHQSTVGKGGEIETQRQDGKENLSHFHANRYALSKLDLGGVRSLSVGIEFAKVYIFRGNL